MKPPDGGQRPAAADSAPANRSRRKLLQLGAAGISAALTSGGASRLSALAQNTPPAAPPTPQAPDATGVIDPTTIPFETWNEPWVWRPKEWPAQALDLNVVERNEPDKAPSQGQIFPGQFSFGGISPGPTIRARGDDVIRVRLRNLLGVDVGNMWIGPCADPLSLPPDVAFAFEREIAKATGKPIPDKPDPAFNIIEYLEPLAQFLSVRTMNGRCMTGVSNSEHGSRVTNLHTHGLHVSPNAHAGRGTESDNVRVRLLSHDDWAMRQSMGGGTCEKKTHEYVGHLDYEFELNRASHVDTARNRSSHPHPPGTFWYHPHAHGSTHDQVSAGMAGFLIVEGDVDDAINTAMTGSAQPDPTTPTGPYDYRERLVFIQRVIIPSVDFNAPPRRRQRLNPIPVPPEGVPQPTVMFMRPGAVERWRVLNASVDGRGFKRVMVLDGQLVFKGDRLYRVVAGDGTPPGRRLVPMTRADIEAAKLPLHQLAFDGITLVTVENGRARYTIRDLSTRNTGTVNPLTRSPSAGESDLEAMLRNFEACFRDGDSLRNAFVRPNEVWMSTANRTDLLFKAPRNAAGKVFTILAQEEILHTDNFQGRLQRALHLGVGAFGPANPGPVDVVVAHVHVRGTPVEGGDFDVLSLRDHLPAVPRSLQPITDDETRMPAAEARARGVPAGQHRSRAVSYSGYGSAGFPLIEVPDSYVEAHPELCKLRWAECGGANILLAPNARTMATNNQIDRERPPAPSKFSPDHPDRSRALVDTAEEWVLYNPSLTLWGHTDREKFPQRGAMLAQYRSYPVSRADGQGRFWRDREFRIVTNATDHPFHIHINPMWVMRIEVPDEQGRLHNLLDAPRWMDTVSIPRNGGRVVFRSRFADFTGRWIHHCHILMHEDMGMMQEFECVADAAASNATPRVRVASHDMTDEEVSAIYPRPSVEVSYRQGLSFVDPNPETGQEFPGFQLEIPRLPD
ncbi:MAG TPA: multicopper oxidase domain-containing protein [Vicinamibacterales bacterium]|jgi:FtsP/CotA-like multicopper oxidase with cupredoxin domain|nr:multicopper oxidase domain-containing protein [Vicinamibacterales bacterium]